MEAVRGKGVGHAPVEGSVCGETGTKACGWERWRWKGRGRREIKVRKVRHTDVSQGGLSGT